MKAKLIETLGQAGHPLAELKGTDGGSILVLPFGGRVLGLFTRDEKENFFWVNSELNEKNHARDFLKADGWKNTGGDRTWVGPEIDLFIKNVLNAWDTYEVPSAVDPGKWTLKKSGDALQLVNQAQVILHRLHKGAEIEIRKEIRAVPNPLRDDRAARKLSGGAAYIGYEQVTTLRFLTEPEAGVSLDIWNLIQLPAGGKLFIPVNYETKPRIYFGDPGKDRLKLSQDCLQTAIDAKKQYKIGVKAAALTGRAGYLRHVEKETWSLLVRNFFVNPSGEYIDVPWDDEKDFGYAFQVYNDDGKFGTFGELEYHTPAINSREAGFAWTDKSQVWAFQGEKRQIDEVYKLLLGCARE